MADDAVRVSVSSETGVVAARQAGRSLSEQIGFSSTQQTLVATAISEIARNMIQYAGAGEILMRVVDEPEKRGLEVTATDNGPGIPNIEKAMADGYTTGGGMGLGLSGARRLMDEFEIHSKLNEGTVIIMKKWIQGGLRK